MNERKERQITICLSDEDCASLMNKCGEHGITINELFENFAGDLAGGSYTNGSDERMLAREWFDRCWFSVEPKNTLLRHLLNHGVDPEEYLNTLAALNSAIQEKEFLLRSPELCESNDIASIENLIYHWQEEIHNCMNEWISEDDSDQIKELQNIAEWIDNRNLLLFRSDSLTKYEKDIQYFMRYLVAHEIKCTIQE